MTGDEQFSMLNVDINSERIIPFIDKDSLFELSLHLSNKINIEKRKVTSLPSLFGELGGLFDFFALIILLVIGKFKANSFLQNTVKTFFLIGFK